MDVHAPIFSLLEAALHVPSRGADGIPDDELGAEQDGARFARVPVDALDENRGGEAPHLLFGNGHRCKLGAGETGHGVVVTGDGNVLGHSNATLGQSGEGALGHDVVVRDQCRKGLALGQEALGQGVPLIFVKTASQADEPTLYLDSGIGVRPGSLAGEGGSFRFVGRR